MPCPAPCAADQSRLTIALKLAYLYGPASPSSAACGLAAGRGAGALCSPTAVELCLGARARQANVNLVLDVSLGPVGLTLHWVTSIRNRLPHGHRRLGCAVWASNLTQGPCCPARRISCIA